jgi:hypothetical protein
MMTKKALITLAVASVAVLIPAEASADFNFKPQHYNARTGISFGPDQFNAGVHAQLGTRATPQIRPAVDMGFGNGVRMVMLGGDVLYQFGGTHWRPYAGGGPGLNFIDVTDGVGEADGMTMKLVAHAVTGITWAPRRGRRSYFVEGRFGFGETPNARVALGMSF